MTLGNYLSKWLRMRLKTLAPRTVEQYTRLIHHCQSIADIELDQLKAWDVAEPIQEALEAGHGRTAEQIYVLLRTALGDAERLHEINHNPVDRFLRPKTMPSEREIWSVEQSRTFVRCALKDRHAIALLLPLLCGLRRGEILGLRWEDVDMSVDMLHIRVQMILLDGGKTMLTPPKSYAGIRDVPIPEVLRPLLASERRIGGQVVGLTHSGLRTALKRVSEHADIPYIGLHGLRHTFATNVIRAGGDMKALQVVMGHASYNTTAMIYTHTDNNQYRTIIEQGMRLVV